MRKLKLRLMKMSNFFFSKNTQKLRLSFQVAAVGLILIVFMKSRCRASPNSSVESSLTKILLLIRIIEITSLNFTEKAQMPISQQQYAGRI